MIKRRFLCSRLIRKVKKDKKQILLKIVSKEFGFAFYYYG